MIVAPYRVAACMTISPPTTRASLFASTMFLPAFTAEGVGSRPAAPTTATTGSVGLVKSSQGFDAFLSKKKLRLIGKGNAGVGGVLEASVGN